jgi:hypothetical protein
MGTNEDEPLEKTTNTITVALVRALEIECGSERKVGTGYYFQD